MTIACKLWLLTVVCVAFLYQDGPQGNGVLCVKKTAHSDEDKSFDEDNADHDSDDQSDDSSGGDDTDGGGVGKNNKDSTVEDDDDDDDGDHKKNSKHETNKQSGKGKNQHHGHDDDDDDDDDDEDNKDGKDEDDAGCTAFRDDSNEEDDKKENKNNKTNIKYKKNNDNGIGEMQIFTTTTITGKPKDILKFLNADVKPYKPVTLDLKKKSNSKLLKKIENITKSSKSSKGKKESNEDLTNYMSNIIKESSKKKNPKQVDPDKILISLVKSVLVKLLKDM